MATERRLGPPYARPPITEAAIEIRVTLPGDVTLETLASLHPAVRDAYPTRRNRYQIEGRIEGQAAGGVAAQARQTQIGYQFVAADGTQIAQCNLDRFSLSRLAPYQGWERFRDEARRLWAIYRATTRPTDITRIGVRYINRLDLPLPFDDFKQFLLTVPEVAPGLPQGLRDYLLRLEIPYDDPPALLVVHQALVPSVAPNVASIILDLDAIREGDVPADEEGLWALVEAFRRVKNEAFEACITDRMREEFC